MKEDDRRESRLAEAATRRTATSFGAWAPGDTDLTYWGDIQFLDPLDVDDDAVQRAWDPDLMRQIVVKLLPGGSPPPVPVVDYLDRMRALARVDHPNLVRIHGVEEHEGLPGLRLELVEGRHLEALVTGGGPLPAGEAGRLLTEVGGALEAIHAAGLVHGSATPRHVRGRPSGAYALMEPSAGQGPDLTRPAPHPACLAPEVLRGERVTPATDVHGLGAILFLALTGERPAAGESPPDVLAAMAAGPPPDVVGLRPDAPTRLAAAVVRALAADPRDRWESVAAFRAAAG